MKQSLSWLLIVAVCLSSGVIWTWIVGRLMREQRVIEYERRRPAPWGLADVLLIFAMYLLFGILLQGATLAMIPAEWKTPLADGPVGDGLETAHELTKLLAAGDPAILVLAILIGAVCAPLCEEFLFRLVFQGGLESVAFARRRHVPRCLVVWLPIIVPAVLFAAMHFRMPGKNYPWQFSAAMMTAGAAAGLATVAIGILWLVVVRRANLSDLGIVRARLRDDADLGVFGALAVIVPAYAVQLGLALAFVALKSLCGRDMPAPDPTAILLLALAWGMMYARTHRIVPSLVSHATFNSLSLMFAILYNNNPV